MFVFICISQSKTTSDTWVGIEFRERRLNSKSESKQWIGLSKMEIEPQGKLL